METVKVTYLSKTINSVLAWACLTVPLLYGIYVLLSAGNYLDENGIAQIAAVIIMSIVSFFIFTGLTNKTLRNREPITEQIYEQWAETSGVKKLPKTSKKYAQAVRRVVRVEWIPSTEKIDKLSIEGYTPMSLPNLESFIKFSESLAPKKKK